MRQSTPGQGPCLMPFYRTPFEKSLTNPCHHRSGLAAESGTPSDGITDLEIPHPTSDGGPIVTASMGISTTVPGAEQSSTDFVACADRALYRSKAEGRDRATFAAFPED